MKFSILSCVLYYLSGEIESIVETTYFHFVSIEDYQNGRLEPVPGCQLRVGSGHLLYLGETHKKPPEGDS